MYDFEDNDTVSMYDVEFCSIDDVVNRVVVYKGAEERLTTNGPRTLVAVTLDDGTYTAFLTSSKKIIEQIGGMQGKFPFRAVMKCVNYGGAFIGFRLFSPNTEITDDDRRLFQQYKKTKFKR